MKILKEEIVKVADISKYEGMNVGYHAGDLGKSEWLGQQRGSNRGTGHFGTGTYFVGDIKKIKLGSYNERPLHVVDFSSYKLLKPSSYDAKNLHKSLKYVNSQYERFMGRGEWNSKDLTGLTHGSFSDRINLLKKYYWLVDPSDPKGVERDFEERTHIALDEFNEETESYNTDRYFEDFSDDLRQFYRDKMNGDHSLWDLKYIFNISEEDLKDLLDSIFIDIQSNPDRRSDSASTRLVKHFGYEGIDVRHIPSMDDTEFGSVIYDLKQNTILE